MCLGLTDDEHGHLILYLKSALCNVAMTELPTAAVGDDDCEVRSDAPRPDVDSRCRNRSSNELYDCYNIIQSFQGCIPYRGNGQPMRTSVMRQPRFWGGAHTTKSSGSVTGRSVRAHT